ncbi:EamA family transporter [Promethearchaeum syntrophicum]|uniref:EamA family transporter n=1 Tax=Promethearchaeum syntrophicum TaxID=2594042 RepID=A0A5B9DBI4_9ARCH|nr:EamA family transporter [Candidatus Prometheoarchaeum syntrophicum]QEE16016.1 4-amino-4-deoxy-L-arabinose-phosphoundecaprenol flippase subunit ArnF [Candidatus Prometheoarchaeum syntrophicum]
MKKSKKSYNKEYILILVPVTLQVLGTTFGKIGASNISIEDFQIIQFFNFFTIIACIVLVLRGFIWLFVLKKFDLAFAYPFMSLSYIFILFISHFYFNEDINTYKIIGSVLITLGTFFLSIGELKKNIMVPKKKEVKI